VGMQVPDGGRNGLEVGVGIDKSASFHECVRPNSRRSTWDVT
jgi:hypothetical protein